MPAVAALMAVVAAFMVAVGAVFMAVGAAPSTVAGAGFMVVAPFMGAVGSREAAHFMEVSVVFAAVDIAAVDIAADPSGDGTTAAATDGVVVATMAAPDG